MNTQDETNEPNPLPPADSENAAVAGAEPSDAGHGDADAGDDGSGDEGPGCFPAIMAATLIMGMLFFIGCGLSAWVIFGKRTVMATRTLENNYVPQVQQSRLKPEDKAALLEQFEDLIRDFKAEKYENWQASGVLQRLVRLPIIQWGHLDAIEAYARTRDPEFAAEAKLHLTRLKRAVEMNRVVALEMDNVLETVTTADDDLLMLRSLNDPLDDESVAEAVKRAKFLADRENVPERVFEDVSISRIVRRQIEAGLTKGMY